MVLLIRSIKSFSYILEDESEQDVLGWNTSIEGSELAEKHEKNIKDFDEVEGIRDCFSISKTEFGTLMDEMGTDYCEEAYIRTIKKPEVDGEYLRTFSASSTRIGYLVMIVTHKPPLSPGICIWGVANNLKAFHREEERYESTPTQE